MVRVRSRLTELELKLIAIISTGLMILWGWLLREWMKEHIPEWKLLGLGFDTWLLILIPVILIVLGLIALDKEKRR